MENIVLYGNRKKQAGLLAITIALTMIVYFTSTLMSPLFILYMATFIGASIYIVVKMFSKKPVLIISDNGILSTETYYAEKMGLIAWRDITEIRDTTFVFIKSIEVYVANRTDYINRLPEKERKGIVMRNGALINISNGEVSMKHDELYKQLITHWEKYRYL